MRSSSVLALLALSCAVLTGSVLADIYWQPTDIDLMEVTRASIQVPHKCEGARHQFAKDFISAHYFDYPETNFDAKFLDGPPKLKFFSKHTMLREISLDGIPPLQIVEILRRWGFKKDSQRAYDVRNEIFNSGKVPTVTDDIPPLALDENGNIVLPEWARQRDEAIITGAIDPYKVVPPVTLDSETIRKDAEQYFAGISTDSAGADLNPEHFSSETPEESNNTSR